MPQRPAALFTLPPAFEDVHPRLQRHLAKADAVLALASGFPGKPGYEAGLARPVVDINDLIPIDSPEEHTAFEHARIDAGLIQHALEDVTVAGLPLGPTVAATLHTGIQREILLALCLAELERRGCRSLAVLGDPRTAEGAAFVRRLEASGRWRLTGWALQRDAHVAHAPLPIALAHPAVLAAPLADDTAARKPHKARALPGFALPRHAATIEPGGVLFVQGTQTALSAVHTLPVLDALLAAHPAAPVSALIAPPADPAPFIERLGPDRVISVAAELSDASAQTRADLAAAVTARLAALYTHAAGLNTWTPLETIRTPRRLAAVVDRAALLAALARLAFDRVAPRSVWLADTRAPFDELIARLAAERAVPTLTGFAAMVADNLRCLPLLSSTAHVALAGEHEHAVLTRRGLNPARQLHITGAPRYDFIHRINAQARRAAVRAELNIAENAKVAAVLTSGLDEHLEQTWLIPLCRWATHAGVVVLIKPHPSRLPRYERIRRQTEQERLTAAVWSSHPATDALCAADLLLTDKSSVTVEAVLLNRPIIQVNLTGESFGYNDFAAEGVATPASTIDDVPRRVQDLLTAPGAIEAFRLARDAFIRRHAHGNDGLAAQRIASLLLTPPAPLTASLSAYIDFAWPDSLTSPSDTSTPADALTNVDIPSLLTGRYPPATPQPPHPHPIPTAAESIAEPTPRAPHPTAPPDAP